MQNTRKACKIKEKTNIRRDEYGLKAARRAPQFSKR